MIGLCLVLSVAAILASVCKHEDGTAEWAAWFGLSTLVGLAVYLATFEIFFKVVPGDALGGYGVVCASMIGLAAIGRLRNGLWWILGIGISLLLAIVNVRSGVHG